MAFQAAEKEFVSPVSSPSEAPPAEPGPLSPDLPISPTRFIGRLADLQRIQDALKQGQMVTLTGPAGIGKTRLALEAARRMRERYPDGIWYVDLASLIDASQILPAVAGALGLREEPGRSLGETLWRSLHRKRFLLLLDRCEPLLPAYTELAETLQEVCPGLDILATSREALGCAGEQAVGVAPLDLPPLPDSHSQGEICPDVLLQYDAARLFVESARVRQPGFALTPSACTAICRLCHHTGGIPLALELASARVSSLSVERIAASLTHYLQLSTRRRRTGVPAQSPDALRAVIQWIYAQLSEKEVILLHRLSIFVGGCTLEAAAEICSDPLPGSLVFPASRLHAREIPGLLASLEENGLVLRSEQEGRARYRLPEAIHDYYCERRFQSSEDVWLPARHSEVFLRLALVARNQLRSPDRDRWSWRLEQEHANLRLALEESLLEASAPVLPPPVQAVERLLRFTAAMGCFWSSGRYVSEGHHYLAIALALPGAGEPVEARADALNALGNLLRMQGAYDQASLCFFDSLTLRRRQNDPLGVVETLSHLGQTAREQGDTDRAERFFTEALTLSRQHSPCLLEALCRDQLASLALLRCDSALAQMHCLEAMAIRRFPSHARAFGQALCALGYAALDRGAPEEARNRFQEAMTFWKRLDDWAGIASTLEGLAQWNCQAGSIDQAILLHVTARSLRSALDVSPPAARKEQEKTEVLLRSQLGEVNYERSIAECAPLAVERLWAFLGEGTSLAHDCPAQ